MRARLRPPLAFAGFSLGMAVARLAGDRLNERLGAGRLLRGGMALVALALVRRLLIGGRSRRWPGSRWWGSASPTLSPSCSAPPAGCRRGPSLAAVFTVGYTGFMVGPPVIGFLADLIGLPQTLGLLCISALSVAAFGGRAAHAGDVLDQQPLMARS